MRVPNRFFGIRDWAYLKAGIREFKARVGARCEIAIMNGTRESAIFSGNNHLNEPRIGMSVDENL